MSGTPVPTRRSGRPLHGEPILERAFRVLGAFAESGEGLPLHTLAARAGLPKSTTSRIAAQLMGVGALERLDNGDFVVGLQLLEIASLAPRGHGLRAAALPFMEDLHQVTRQHILLAVRDGHEAVLVERLSARDAAAVKYRVGGRLPSPKPASASPCWPTPPSRCGMTHWPARPTRATSVGSWPPSAGRVSVP